MRGGIIRTRGASTEHDHHTNQRPAPAPQSCCPALRGRPRGRRPGPPGTAPLAFELAPGTTAEVLEADHALRAVDGPRPDGACPPNLAGNGPDPRATAYIDQLEARYRQDSSWCPTLRRPGGPRWVWMLLAPGSGGGRPGARGVRVLAVDEHDGELELAVQTSTDMVGCPGCGAVAAGHGRRAVRVRDLPVGGRPTTLIWIKRLWRCRHDRCETRTWSETSPQIPARGVADDPRRAGGLPPGRARRGVSRRRRLGSRSRVGHGDARGGRARRPAGR